MKGLLKTLLLVAVIAIACVVGPWLAVLLFTALGLTLPIVGGLMIVFLPLVLIGAMIGYFAGKKDK